MSEVFPELSKEDLEDVNRVDKREDYDRPVLRSIYEKPDVDKTKIENQIIKKVYKRFAAYNAYNH